MEGSESFYLHFSLLKTDKACTQEPLLKLTFLQMSVCVSIFSRKLEREWGACKKESSPLFGGTLLIWGVGSTLGHIPHAQPHIWTSCPFSHSLSPCSHLASTLFHRSGSIFNPFWHLKSMVMPWLKFLCTYEASVIPFGTWHCPDDASCMFFAWFSLTRMASSRERKYFLSLKIT